MKIWRDIIPHDVWTQVVKRHLGLAGIKGSDVWKRAKDDELGSKYTRRDLLDILGCHIKIYHQVDKTSYSKLDRRIGHLKELSRQAKLYLDNFAEKGVDPTQRVQQRSKFGYFAASNSRQESLERNLLTLQRRSLRKASYLEGIKTLYDSNSSSGLTAPRDFVDYLKNPNKNTANSLLDIQPGVRMEALDPAHRSFEADGALDLDDESQRMNLNFWNNGEIGYALNKWYGEVFINNEHRLPFFLWLEGEGVCLRDNKASQSVDRSVGYVGQNVNGADIPKLKIVDPSTGQLRMYDFRRIRSDVADTSSYTAAAAKGPNNGQAGGSGIAAFAWLQNNEIVIGEHAEHQFHHTSFAAGHSVQCAGMIKIKQGLVEWVSNNSGHYRPKKEHVDTFTQFLKSKGVANDNTTKVDCFGIAPHFYGSLGVFRYKMIAKQFTDK